MGMIKNSDLEPLELVISRKNRKCSDQALSVLIGVKFDSEHDGEVFRSIRVQEKVLEPVFGLFSDKNRFLMTHNP